ncbi:MAG: thioesterase [Alphaproteobacteria bacterium]|jgi:uncharacterized protein (TIGR00369 family)|nr:thioesterase [Alphaproteobacteria bacterium]PPR12854.1 MAG: hypothetical protein CFH42_01830 [Alphaproteobacteria bacterium MarineAlpha12_Bin1]|tara:strand:- start:1960 stop:2373 length:414 start_codon:yes stop_codon:yes gene_type:complete
MTKLSVAEGQSIIDTKMAPWVKDLNIQVIETLDNGATLRMPYGDHLARTGGVISGQSMLAFADAAMVIVISSSLGGYQNMTTVDMTTSFMTAAYETDIIAKGEIVKAGKRMIFGQIRLYGVKSDTPVANVWTTWMLL